MTVQKLCYNFYCISSYSLCNSILFFHSRKKCLPMSVVTDTLLLLFHTKYSALTLGGRVGEESHYVQVMGMIVGTCMSHSGTPPPPLIREGKVR